MIRKIFTVTLLVLFFIIQSQSQTAKKTTNSTWRFAVIGDTHIPVSDTVKTLIPYMMADSISLVLVCGDLVNAGKRTTAVELESQLNEWLTAFKPLYDAGIEVYPVRGNHEDDAANDIEIWNKIFSGDKQLPQNGPSGELNLTYSFIKNNALFIGLDNYLNIHRVNQEWLDNQLNSNQQTHVFVFGHESAFKVFHTDCLDDYSAERNTFWQSLSKAGVKCYFCGHDHFFNTALISDNDNDTSNDIYQVLTGGGGGWLMSQYNYNGTNSGYQPKEIFHSRQHGYILVEISGKTNSDLIVTLKWKEKVPDIITGTYKFVDSGKYITYTAKSKTPTGISEQKSSGYIYNYPNPFGPSSQSASKITTLEYYTEKAGPVNLSIYDCTGRKILTPVNEFQNAGLHKFKLSFSSGFSSGNYYYLLITPDSKKSGCITFIK